MFYFPHAASIRSKDDLLRWHRRFELDLVVKRRQLTDVRALLRQAIEANKNDVAVLELCDRLHNLYWCTRDIENQLKDVVTLIKQYKEEPR